MVKFTFKKQPRETGLASVISQGETTNIRHNKLVVGAINPPNRFAGRDLWSIKLAVTTEYGFRWVVFTAKFETEPAAREWLKAHQDKIFEKHDLYYFED